MLRGKAAVVVVRQHPRPGVEHLHGRSACVDLRLQVVSPGQQLAINGCQIVNNGLDAGPKRIGIESCCGQQFVYDEGVELRIHLKAADCDVLR